MLDDRSKLFARRLKRKVQRSPKLTAEQRSELLRRIEEPAFVARVIERTEQRFGGPVGGNWLEWLKGLPWMQIISIALTLLTLILEERS